MNSLIATAECAYSMFHDPKCVFLSRISGSRARGRAPRACCHGRGCLVGLSFQVRQAASVLDSPFESEEGSPKGNNPFGNKIQAVKKLAATNIKIHTPHW